MISIEQLNGEISMLEDEVPTHAIMQKLASLYIIRDHISVGKSKSEQQEELYTTYGESDFLKAISGKNLRSVMLKMDELMTTLYVLNPKLYQNAINELRLLS
jgi:hypothetical protein